MLPAVSHPAQICVPTAKGSTEPSVASTSFISRHLSELLEENGKFLFLRGFITAASLVTSGSLGKQKTNKLPPKDGSAASLLLWPTAKPLV